MSRSIPIQSEFSPIVILNDRDDIRIFLVIHPQQLQPNN